MSIGWSTRGPARTHAVRQKRWSGAMNYLRWWLLERGASTGVRWLLVELAREDARGPAEEVEWGRGGFRVE